MSSAAADAPLAALTVTGLVSLLNQLLRDHTISPDTPIALSSDAEGNAFRWLMGWATDETHYAGDQFPYSLNEEPGGRVNPALTTAQNYLILFPAD